MAEVGTTQENFNRVGNLAFYDGFHRNYIYFKSLDGSVYSFKQADGSSTPYKNRQYEVLAQKAINDVKSQQEIFSLKNAHSFLQESNYVKKFNDCLKVIQKGIEYETKNEIAYFKQQLQAFEKTFSQDDIKAVPEIAKIHQLLQEGCSKNTIVDYNAFLALVNGLLSGFKDAYAIAKYENKHIQDISKALRNILEKRENQLHGLAQKQSMDLDKEEKMIKKSLEHLNKKINVYYVQYKTYNKSTDKIYNRNTNKMETTNVSLRGATRAFRTVHQTADNEVAKWMRKQLENIFKNRNVMEQITAYLKNIGAIGVMANYNDAANEIKSIIADSVAAHASQYIPEIINRKYLSMSKQKMVKLLENSIDLYQTYRIEGFYPNHFMTGRHLKAFKEMEEGFDLHEASSEMFIKMFNRLKAANEKKGRKLSKERSKLYDFLNGKNIYQDFSELENIVQRLNLADEKLQLAQEKLRRGKYDFTDTKEYIEQTKLGTNDKGQTVTLSIRITKKKAEIIDDLGESIRSLSTIQKLFGNTQLTFSTIKNSIANLHRQGSIALRDQLADLVDTAVAEAVTAEQTQLKNDLYKMIRDGLQNLHISVRGPDEAEIVNAIRFRNNDKYQIVVDVTGPRNIKNDSIVISLDSRNFKLSKPLQTILDNREQRMTDMIAAKVSSEDMASALNAKVVSTFEKSVAQAFEANSTKQSKRYSANASAFLQGYQNFKNRTTNNLDPTKNMNKIYDKLWNEWSDYAREITDRGESKTYFEKKYEDFLSAIEKTFYVSSTVKSYDYYNDSIGFGGGSLGGNLMSQLSNIADIFTLAGCPISQNEIQWLFFLIRNTSDQTIFGTKYQSIIEQYFSSLAAFMLFDEGGAEVKILKDLQKKSTLGYSTPKILHLYYVNGIYVTGSYVLQKAKEELLNYQKIMDGVLTSRNEGANIRIINTMNEGMIHNRGANATPTPAENPWEQVGKVANNNVRLEIFFLAGLLDIADKLESKLSNIQLPSK